jgi:hypothetical protein
MPLGGFILIAYLSLAAGVLVLLSHSRRVDAERPASPKTLWAWGLLLLAPVCYVGTAFLLLLGMYGLAGYRSGSSIAVETAAGVAGVLSVLIPTVAGVVLGALGWRESRGTSPVVASVANGVLASLTVALYVTPLTTGGQPGWTPEAGLVTSLVLLAVGLLVAHPWGHHLTGPAQAHPG